MEENISKSLFEQHAESDKLFFYEMRASQEKIMAAVEKLGSNHSAHIQSTANEIHALAIEMNEKLSSILEVKNDVAWIKKIFWTAVAIVGGFLSYLFKSK